MFNEMMVAAESGMSKLMSILKVHINDYCDLETTDGQAFVAKDGSMGTLLRYQGFKSLVGKEEYRIFTNEIANGLEQFLGARGHQMQVVYFRDDDPENKVMRVLQPSYDACRLMELQLTDLIDEKVAVARHFCMDEEVYIVLWTRPAVMDPMELKMSSQETREMRQRYKVPPMADAQNVMRPIRFLADRHEAFVAKFVNDIRTLNGAIDRVDIHEALCEMKRYLYKNTPFSWRPVLNGDPLIGRWKNKKTTDVSAAMYYRLDDQLFSMPAQIGTSSGDGGLTDTRAVRLGSRIFAPIMVKIPQQRKTSFTPLFSALNNAVTKNADGKASPMPWSISYLIEGDGLRGITLRKIMAGILAWTSSDNRNLVKAAQALTNYKLNENGAVVKLQMTAVTWADYGEEKELMRRRQKLSSALQGWGSCTVEEETGDPTESLMTCVPGMRLKSPATSAASPLDWATYMLPLARPASAYTRGSTLFRTLDGKLMPWEVFSDQQSTWITAMFGGPGSGKSVLANRLNTEMCMLPGMVRLPYICVIDIGISSSGFISLIKDSLPEHKKHQAVYARVQNTAEYRVNQFDTQLGLRMPLPRDRELMKNFLVRLATPPERGKPHAYINEFAGKVIDEAFKRNASEGERATPKPFALNVNPMIKEMVISTGIDYNDGTKWWDIVDEFFDRGMVYEASVAQRYAQPILWDLIQIASDPEIGKQFASAIDENGTSVVEEFKLMIGTASGDFPIFNGETRYDIGESRVMAIDLQDVVTTGSAAARKQASLMYMVAMNAFMRKISIIEEDLVLIPEKYKAYHARRIAELAEDYKRLFCDEYHKTGGDATLRESFLIYGRESRKWLLEIVLASQLPQDFESLAEIATTIIILDSGNEQTRGTIQRIFGLSQTEVAALKRYVNGAIPGVGATFLAKIKTKNAEISQLFTATSGGLELWGLSTTAEDRALRTALYRNMPSDDARAVLKERFPSGSCKSYVLDQKSNAKGAEGFVDDDKIKSLLETLADDLTAEWRRKQTAKSAVI